MASLTSYVQLDPPGSFDDLLAALPGNLPKLFNQLLEAAPSLGIKDTPVLDGLSVIVAGWSDQQSGMVACEYDQQDRAEGFSVERIDAFTPHRAPYSPEIERMPCNSPAAMERLAIAQRRLMREKCPGQAAGGRLITCHLTKESALITRGIDLDATK